MHPWKQMPQGQMPMFRWERTVASLLNIYVYVSALVILELEIINMVLFCEQPALKTINTITAISLCPPFGID